MERSGAADAEFVARAKEILHQQPLAANAQRRLESATGVASPGKQSALAAKQFEDVLTQAELEAHRRDGAMTRSRASRHIEPLEDLYELRGASGGFGPPEATLKAYNAIEKLNAPDEEGKARRLTSAGRIRWQVNGEALPEVVVQGDERSPVRVLSAVPAAAQTAAGCRVEIRNDNQAVELPVLVRLWQGSSDPPEQPAAGRFDTSLDRRKVSVGEVARLVVALKGVEMQDRAQDPADARDSQQRKLASQPGGPAVTGSSLPATTFVLRIGLPPGTRVDDDAMRRLAEAGAVGAWQRLENELSIHWLRAREPLEVVLTATSTGRHIGAPSRCHLVKEGTGLTPPDQLPTWWAPGLTLDVSE